MSAFCIVAAVYLPPPLALWPAFGKMATPTLVWFAGSKIGNKDLVLQILEFVFRLLTASDQQSTDRVWQPLFHPHCLNVFFCFCFDIQKQPLIEGNLENYHPCQRKDVGSEKDLRDFKLSTPTYLSTELPYNN